MTHGIFRFTLYLSSLVLQPCPCGPMCDQLVNVGQLLKKSLLRLQGQRLTVGCLLRSRELSKANIPHGALAESAPAEAGRRPGTGLARAPCGVLLS